MWSIATNTCKKHSGTEKAIKTLPIHLESVLHLLSVVCGLFDTPPGLWEGSWHSMRDGKVLDPKR